MAQQPKVLVIQFDSLSSIPRTYKVEEEQILTICSVISKTLCFMRHAPKHTYIHINTSRQTERWMIDNV